MVMCQHTRYPAVYLLKWITTKAMVKALILFISVFSISIVIQTDWCSDFSLHFLASVKAFTGKAQSVNAFHAQSWGTWERLDQMLKSRFFIMANYDTGVHRGATSAAFRAHWWLRCTLRLES